jgi:hypothetical protein
MERLGLAVARREPVVGSTYMLGPGRAFQRKSFEVFLMGIDEQVKQYIAAQPEPKRSDMQELHRIILNVMPKCRLWFMDGKDDSGKTVSNPNVGYGIQTITYANGSTREFYQIGISANTTGISVYILGVADRKYLAKAYGKDLGKAKITGYCIKFKALSDIRIETLEAAIRYGIDQTTH